MALNIDKIKARLAQFDKKGKSQSKAKDVIWKPQQPSQVIRIVPLQSTPDDPFIRLKFHYDFAGKNYLSPSSFNQPDPIVELADRLKKNKDTWQQGRKLEPKLRTYVPVLVRGEEEKGVRFWGFGVQIYNQLMQLMVDADYGDITSLTEGYDLTVFYKTAEEVKKDYPEISFQPKPKPRPVVDPSHPKAKEIMELVTTKQPNLLEVYETPTYETLSEALEDFLKKATAGQQAPTDQQEDSNVVLPTEEQIAAATAPAPVAQVTTQTSTPTVTQTPASVVSPSAAKAVVPVSAAQDLTKAFDNLFNS